MKKLFIVANWKSNKTSLEATTWLQEVVSNKYQVLSDKEIIICPPFTLLSTLKSSIMHHKSFLKVGSQDVSPFAGGAYTGEVSAQQVKEFATHVIIGHSERRKDFGETEEIISLKIDQAIKNNLIPIVCISDIKQIGNSSSMVAYEPLSAIGSGEADDPKNADEMAKKIKEIAPGVVVLYGGSVTPENVADFTQMPHIDGVLVGGASLDPQEFSKIITNA